MAQSELYKKGLAMWAKLDGEAAKSSHAALAPGPVMKKFVEVGTETTLGALWSRPGLDLKSRTLVIVISDAATGRDDELAIHLRFALNQGWTEEELTEALIQLSGYVGVPLARGALLVAEKVFEDRRAVDRGQQA